MLITIFLIVALIFSAILHEFAHGFAAYLLGDNTAKNAGRLTLNPVAHLDPVGSILMPVLIFFTHFGVAWAKPVPYNPYNLRDQRFGDLKVGLAGPGMNALIAIFFGLFSRLLPIAQTVKIESINAFMSGNYELIQLNMQGSLAVSLFALSLVVIFVNLLLMLFNLLPIPPLDGSKVILNFLPYHLQLKWAQLETYGFMIIITLSYLGAFNLLEPVLGWLFLVLTIY
ncbi:MAG: site-2 protease family protein [bacterium]